jgi:hypothetical protein
MCVGLAGWTDAGVVVSACVRWSAWLLSLCGLASRGAWVVGWRAGVCVVVWGPWGSPAFQSSATSSRRAVGGRMGVGFGCCLAGIVLCRLPGLCSGCGSLSGFLKFSCLNCVFNIYRWLSDPNSVGSFRHPWVSYGGLRNPGGRFHWRRGFQ